MKYFLTLIFSFLLLDIQAQKIYLPVQEKSVLLDTINDLREKFTNKLIAKDSSVVQLLNTQIVFKKNDTIEIFFPTERAMGLFLINDYKTLLTDINEYLDFHANDIPRDIKWKKKEYNYSTLMGFVPSSVDTSIIKELMEDSARIKMNIKQSSIQPFEKDFLYLYLESILAYNDLEHFDTDAMNRKADVYTAAYKVYPYTNYVDTILNIKLHTRELGIGIGFSTGYNAVSGSFANYFNNSIPIAGNLEAGYKKYLLKGEAAGSFQQPVKKDFTYHNHTWAKDTAVVFFYNLNLNLAYVLIQHDFFDTSPFVGISDIVVSQKYDMHFNPAFNIGIDFDWKFHKIKSYDSYYQAFYTKYHNAYEYVRFRCGYTQLKNEDSRFKGSLIYAKLAIGVYSRGAKRI